MSAHAAHGLGRLGLLFLLLAAAGASAWGLGLATRSTVPAPSGDSESLLDAAGREGGRPSGIAPLREEAPAERVAIWVEGTESLVDQPPPEGWLEVPIGDLGPAESGSPIGSRLLDALARHARVRVPSEADLEALRRLEPRHEGEPTPQSDEPVLRVLDFWREQGLQVFERYPYVFVRSPVVLDKDAAEGSIVVDTPWPE